MRRSVLALACLAVAGKCRKDHIEFDFRRQMEATSSLTSLLLSLNPDRLSTPSKSRRFVLAAIAVAPLQPALADSTLGESKLLGGGASTLQSGRRITITRGVNLDNTDWKGEDLKGVAFQQSKVRSSNFEDATLEDASFFDADLAFSNFKNAKMNGCNMEMSDVSNADFTNADLSGSLWTGAVMDGPKGSLTQVDNTDWSEAELTSFQQKYLCKIAKGTNPVTGRDTRESLLCPDAFK